MKCSRYDVMYIYIYIWMNGSMHGERDQLIVGAVAAVDVIDLNSHAER